ncbi:methyltransferase family protein [Shinella sp.]|uniref:methyltransferase family protein n=1 Tax=Shinella sp. TaxID=1870904 RepID=UPI003D2821E1
MPSLPLLSATLMGVYLAAFLALTARSARAAGRPAWLFGLGGRQGLPALLFRLSFAGALVYPALLAAGLPPAPALVDPSLPVRLAGLLLALGGGVFAVHAQHHMGTSWRIGSAAGHSGAIVDTGPFRLSRNPVFVGQVMLLAGFAITRPDAVQLALTAVLVLAVRLQVRVEEDVLAQDLGAAYRAYRQRVPRWL